MYFLFAAIHHLKSSPTFSVRPRSSVGRVTVDLIRRSWVRFPPRSKDFFFPSCGSPISIGSISTLINLHFTVNSLFHLMWHVEYSISRGILRRFLHYSFSELLFGDAIVLLFQFLILTVYLQTLKVFAKCLICETLVAPGIQGKLTSNLPSSFDVTQNIQLIMIFTAVIDSQYIQAGQFLIVTDLSLVHAGAATSIFISTTLNTLSVLILL